MATRRRDTGHANRMRKTIQKAATSLALIVMVALGARIGFAWDQTRKMPPGVLGNVPFQNETGNIAYSLAEGKGFSNVFRTGTGPTAWLAPVYPLIVGAVFRVFGIFTTRAFFACVSFNILFSSAACVPIFFAGKKISGIEAASGAAWLWALFPNAILIPFEWIWETSLAAFLGAALLWATLEIAESWKMPEWCGYGFLWGIALMTNPALGVLLPFLLGWAALRSRGESRLRWKRAALAAGVAVLCCVPWTIRNYVAFHRLIPLRSNLPFELWLGNNDIFDEHARNGRKVITRTEEARRYTQTGETAYMQEKWMLATSFMKKHPDLELQLAGRKFADFWLGTEAPIKNFRETDSGLIRAILILSFLTGVGALFGIVALGVRQRSLTFPLAVFPVIFPCLYYVTHADLRYRHPVDPVVCLLTAVAAAAALELVGARKSEGAGKDVRTGKPALHASWK
jgi:4-amino-4-deoxy-L-arabinose transferase-like glycosyltransferase